MNYVKSTTLTGVVICTGVTRLFDFFELRARSLQLTSDGRFQPRLPDVCQASMILRRIVLTEQYRKLFAAPKRAPLATMTEPPSGNGCPLLYAEVARCSGGIACRLNAPHPASSASDKEN